MDKNDSVTISQPRKPSMTVQTVPETPQSPAAVHRGGCPVMAFQAMISGKYKIRILWDLKDGPRRYGEIRTGLLRGAAGTAEIAPRVLSRELKALAAAGLIARKDYGLVPPKVEYCLTEAGESFTPVIASIRQWGERHLGGSGASGG
jgi:DNA-binding HxlR family transcriptional regulator